MDKRGKSDFWIKISQKPSFAPFFTTGGKNSIG